MALDEARKAYKEGEIPIGAVVVCKDRIIARAHNLPAMKRLFLRPNLPAKRPERAEPMMQPIRALEDVKPWRAFV